MQKIKLKNYLGILLIAFSISPLSFMLNAKCGLGNNIIEPYFLIGLFLISRNKLLALVFTSWIGRGIFSKLLLLLLFLFSIGMLRTDGDVSIVYADLRCNILILYAFFLFQQPELFQWENGKIIRFMLWSSILMDLLYSILYFRDVMAGLESNPRITMVCIINCVVLLVLYLHKWRNLNKAFFILMILTYHVVVSSMRNFYLIYIMAILIFAIYLFRERGRKFQKLIIISAMVMIPIMYWDSLMDFWMSDSSRAIHSVNRVTETVSGESVETERINSILYPLTDPLYYIFPHGLGWRGFIKEIQHHYPKGSILSSMDSQFYYLFFHYGSLIAIIIIYFIFKNAIFNILRCNKIRLELIFLLALYSIAFFTQATMFAYLSFAFYYGLLLAMLIRPKYNLLLHTNDN